ncbi:MAG: hypothetical protein NTW59_02870 [Candidatus Diapherotrites archaeon]|nr:hypothetical protein [Candidatus Diapherotrites archaeon]
MRIEVVGNLFKQGGMRNRAGIDLSGWRKPQCAGGGNWIKKGCMRGRAGIDLSMVACAGIMKLPLQNSLEKVFGRLSAPAGAHAGANRFKPLVYIILINSRSGLKGVER